MPGLAIFTLLSYLNMGYPRMAYVALFCQKITYRFAVRPGSYCLNLLIYRQKMDRMVQIGTGWYRMDLTPFGPSVVMSSKVT